MHYTIDTCETLASVELEHIRRAMKECSGNISKAAKQLGLHRRTLQRKLKRCAPARGRGQ